MISRRPRSARGSGGQLRTEILEAAADLLARTGDAEAVSIREIGRRVGVSAPSIYRHFADKDALIEAVVVRVFENLDAALTAATDPTKSPITRMRDQGLAYIRFALDHPEQYRIATARHAGEGPNSVDLVLSSGVFQRFAGNVRDAMDTGTITPGDPMPIVLELWAAAHGLASLLIAKPYLPWGDIETVAERVLGAACVGHLVLDTMSGGGPTPSPDEGSRWLEEMRRRM